MVYARRDERRRSMMMSDNIVFNALASGLRD